MAWVPSHQELRDHPKTKRAARKAGVPLVQMVGHLHMIWWWALDHAPDGDVSRFDADDLADAAMWEGDPETLVKALRECGPGDSEGFLEDGGKLHDWDEYGGKYGKRVQAARKAAAVRWHSEDDADAMQPECEGNADASGVASQPQSNRNAEERRGEESTNPSSSAAADPEVSDDARSLTRKFALAVRDNGFSVPKQGQKAHGTWLVDMDRLVRLGPPGGDPDPQDPDVVERVIDFATQDEFWRANIGSPGKLREQFPKLRLRMQDGSGGAVSVGGEAYAAMGDR